MRWPPAGHGTPPPANEIGNRGSAFRRPGAPAGPTDQARPTGETKPLGRRWHAWCVAVAVLALAVPSWASDLEEDEVAAWRAAVEQVAPSVVRIDVISSGDTSNQQNQRGSTTGLIATADGLILTSDWLFGSATASVLVTLPDGARLAAQVLGRDHTRSLVALHIAAGRALAVPQPAIESEIRVGQWAVAVGNTFADAPLHRSIGIVSALDRLWGRALQTDAKVSPHNYGGPLVDVRGRVLGLLVPLAPDGVPSSQHYDSGVGFAVPWEHVLHVAPRLAAGEDLLPGLAGLTLASDDNLDSVTGLVGVRLGSPAAKAGLQPDDIITHVDGEETARVAQLLRQLNGRYAGESVAVRYRRGVDSRQTRLEFVAKVPTYTAPWLGCWPGRALEGAGVPIARLAAGAPADRAGLQADDTITVCDGQAIGDVPALERALAGHLPGEKVAVTFRRGQQENTLDLTLEPFPLQSTPAAANAAAPAIDNHPPTAMVEIELAGPKGPVHLRWPPQATPDIAPGLIVWLSDGSTGPVLTARSAAACDQACLRHNWALLALGPAQAGVWRKPDFAHLQQVLVSVLASRPFDRRRLVVVGDGAGRAPAVALAMPGHVLATMFRGLVVWRGAPPRQLAESNPARRMLVAVAPEESPVRVSEQRDRLEALREQGYPVVQFPAAGATDSSAELLVAWDAWLAAIDAL